MKNRIIQEAREQYMKFGYGKVTMDEIALELGISKKTMYNHFEGKEALLFEVINQLKTEFEGDIQKIENNPPADFKQEIEAVLSVLGNWISRLSNFLPDLKRSVPQAYELLVKYRNDVVLSHGMTILKKGEQLGYVRDGAKSNLALFVFLIAAEKISESKYLQAVPNEMASGFDTQPQPFLKSVLELLYEGLKPVNP